MQSVEHLIINLDDLSHLATEVPHLSIEEVHELVHRLKAVADDNWQKRPNHSLRLGQVICDIGKVKYHSWIYAFGLMVCGDAHEKLSDYHSAWDCLSRAGTRFWAIDDKVGWARTWIGRLSICIDLQRVDETIQASSKAHDILDQSNEILLQFRLAQAIGILNDKCGKHVEAMEWYGKARSLIDDIPAEYESEIGDLFVNSGFCYHLMGHFETARTWYMKARSIYEKHKKQRVIAMTDLNLASIDKEQGNFLSALEIFYRLEKDQHLNLHHVANMKRSMVTCYLNLNCPNEAHEVANEANVIYRQLQMPYEQAMTLLDLAFALSQLNINNALEQALQILQTANDLFDACFSTSDARGGDLTHWQAMISLYRSYIALKLDDFKLAYHETIIAINQFAQSHQLYRYGDALIIQIQACFELGETENLQDQIVELTRIGNEIHNPNIIYYAHLLQGRYDQLLKQNELAVTAYHKAISVIRHLQDNLTMSLRPLFLEDKGEPYYRLIEISLEQGNVDTAFTILEQLKSQALSKYITNQKDLPLNFNANLPHDKIEEFNHLRLELRRLAGKEEFHSDAYIELEKKLLMLTRIVDYSADTKASQTNSHSQLHDLLQSQLKHDILIEYYIHEQSIGAFVVTANNVQYHTLDVTITDIEKSLASLQRYIRRRLALNQPNTLLLQLTRENLQTLYNSLVRPLLKHIKSNHRIHIVPFGTLHYVPFHLLFDGSEYLIEQQEIVIQPSAGLLTRLAPKRRGQVLALAWRGDDYAPLPMAEDEAKMVANQLGGKWVPNATRHNLQEESTSVLHIVSHGEYHQQPELSHIELSDGPLYSAELLQYDLQYELITLSACETGQARPSGGDELIGLGRTFLHAGAGALITSMWRVDDQHAYEFMEKLYKYLNQGLSKSTALQTAYRETINQFGDEHPALWGAFQLSGNPEPLSFTQV